MKRRTLLDAAGTACVGATAGCSTLRGSETLSDPTVHTDSNQRKSLRFSADDEELASFGASGGVSSGVIYLSTEIPHGDGTNLTSISLRVWMPPPAASTMIAVVSPVQGDSSPPPLVTLSTPEDGPGTIIDISDLDDLKDETISTLNLIVRPGSETGTSLGLAPTLQLVDTGPLPTTYTLTGQLQLEFPELADQ
jgi:hypothetical protein